MTFKRTLTMLLALCMIIGCLPSIALAEETSDPIVIQAGEEKHVEVWAKDDDYYQYTDIPLSFTPTESGTYVLYRTSDNVHGISAQFSDGYGMYRYQFDAQAGTSYYFTASVSWYEAESAIASFMVEKAVPLESLSTDSDHRMLYMDENIINDFMLSFSPVNALVPEITITSSNSAVAYGTVYEDHIDVITVGPGDAVLSISAGSFTKDIGVTVPRKEYVTLTEPATISLEAGEEYEQVFYFDPPAEGGSFVALLTGGNGLCQGHISANYNQGETRSEFSYFPEYEYIDGHGDASITINLRNRGLATTFQLAVMETVPLTGLSFEKTEYTFYLDHSYLANLHPVCQPINGLTGELTWTSSNPDVLNFDHWGNIEPYAEGETTVTVTSEYGQSASCKVTVKDPEFDTSSLVPVGELALGQSQSFTAPLSEYTEVAYLFTPSTSGCYYFWADSPNGERIGVSVCIPNCIGLRFDVQDVSYFMEAGTTYMIVFTARIYEGMGAAQITVGADNCVPATGIEIYCGKSINSMVTEYYVGDWTYVDVNYLPANGAPEQITWSLSNDQVARFEDPSDYNAGESDSLYLLDLIAPGTVTVTATSESGLTDSITLTVREMPRIYLDTPIQISPTMDSYGTPLKFIPEDSGWYAFTEDLDSHSLSREIQSVEEGYISNTYEDGYTSAYLEAGKEYIVYYSLPFETETPIVCNAIAKQLMPAQSLRVYTSDSPVGYVGGDAYLRTEFAPEFSIRENVTWSVDNTEVASLFGSDWENTSVYFDAPGTVTVTATSESGLSDSITFTVASIPELVLNTPLAATLGKYTSLFSFTPSQSGWYRFSEGSDLGSDVNRRVSEYDSMMDPEVDYGPGYVAAYLEAGKTYRLHLTLDDYYPEDSVTCNVLVEKMAGPESIEIGIEHRILPYCVGDSISLYAMTYPEDAAPEAVTWTAITGASLVELESWSNFCYVQLKGKGTVTLQAATASGVADSITFTISEMPVLPIDSKTTVSLDAENPARYSFTPPQSGWYAFVNDHSSPDMIQTMLIDRSSEFGEIYQSGTYDQYYRSYYMEAGNEYEVRFYSYSYGEPTTCDVHVEMLESPISFTLTSHIESTTVLKSEWGYDFDPISLLQDAEGTFTWADGSTSTWSFAEDGWQHSHMALNMYSEPVEEGVHRAVLTWGGVSDSFTFDVHTKQVQKLEVVDDENVYLVENTEGSLATDYNGNDYWEYYTWPLSYSLKLKVTFTDGTSEIVSTLDELYGQNFFIYTDQASSPWTIGGENLVTIEYGGHYLEYSVEIRKNPVTGFTLSYPEHKTKITIGDPAYGVTTDEGFMFYPSDDSIWYGLTFTVTYNDGTPARTYTYEELLETEGMINGFHVSLYADEMPEYVKAGDTLTVVTEYLGAKDAVTLVFVDPKPILDGDDGSWVVEDDEGADIRVDADPEDLVEVYVDGQLVDPKHYTVTRGSTIITFTPEFLSTLELGVHDVAIAFTDARAITTLTIRDGSYIPGDVDGDGVVNDSDVEYLLWHLLFGEMYPISCDADFDNNGSVNDGDVEYLLWHLLFGEMYPID